MVGWRLLQMEEKMVAGHLQEKRGTLYAVLSFQNEEGKRQTKWINTGYSAKGNKKKAEQFLVQLKRDFEHPVPESERKELFSDFMLSWLAMMKNRVEVVTYASYARTVKNRVVPYFKEKKIALQDLQPRHIQEYYQYEMDVRGVSANTVIHYHANIRKALQYAVKTDQILSNPADKIERPRKDKFSGSFFSKEEVTELFKVVKGTPIELGVLLAAFYGLRRSEITGLKWRAIDFQNKSITISHTVTVTSIDGKVVVTEKDRTKNKASHRTLPLVPMFEDYLKNLKDEQEQNRKRCKNAYCMDYLEYVYVDAMGVRIKPDYLTRYFPIVLKQHGFRRIRFHDLRHSCASLLLASGVGMKEIQEWLGHSDFSTTANIYAHLDYSSKIASAGVLSDTLLI